MHISLTTQVLSHDLLILTDNTNTGIGFITEEVLQKCIEGQRPTSMQRPHMVYIQRFILGPSHHRNSHIKKQQRKQCVYVCKVLCKQKGMWGCLCRKIKTQCIGIKSHQADIKMVHQTETEKKLIGGKKNHIIRVCTKHSMLASHFVLQPLLLQNLS